MDKFRDLRQRFTDKLEKHWLKDHSEFQESQPQFARNVSFTYEPLDSSIPGFFRLVRLEHGSHGDPIRCTLISAVWSSENTSYEALSYVWGDSAVANTILLDEQCFVVTANLYTALYNLRSLSESRMLWIDAICIDQNNVEEKNQQVRSMGQIYQSCDRVIIWLGEEDAETEVTLKFIDAMSKRVLKSWHFKPTVWMVWDYTFSNSLLSNLFNSSTAPRWMAVCRLLERSWWRRAWVFQEFVRASDAIFYLGRFTVGWEELYYMIKIMYSASDMQALLRSEISEPAATLTDANDMIYAKLRSRSANVTRTSGSPNGDSMKGFKLSYFAYLLHCQRSRGCGDPRDKVYSILSMADADVAHALSPNYSESVRWTYMLAVKVHIRVYQNLDILCYSMHSHLSPTSEYPSWCPDWREPQNRSILGSTVQSIDVGFNASGGRAPHAKFSRNDDDGILQLKGVKIDIVTEACVQGSVHGFSWKSMPSGLRCNWDLKSMAAKVLEVKGDATINEQNHDTPLAAGRPGNGGSEDGKAEKSLYKSLIHTLVAGFYTTTSSRTIDPPALVQDHLTREYWPDDRIEFFKQVYQRTWGRTVIITQHGHLGLAPQGTKVGDEIWVLWGCAAPIILRRDMQGTCEGDTCRWLGDAYVHGAMNGEAVADMEDGWFGEGAVMIR